MIYPIQSDNEALAPLDAFIREVNRTQKAELEDTPTKELLTSGLAHLIAGRLMLTGHVPHMEEP